MGERPVFTFETLDDTLVLTHDSRGHESITIGHIPELYEYGDGECGHLSVERAERIVALWNAMRDIDDPAAYVARVERLVAASKIAHNFLIPAGYDGIARVLESARADLAATSKHD